MKFEIDNIYTNNAGEKVALLYRTANSLAFIGAMGVYYTDLDGKCANSGKSVKPDLEFVVGKYYKNKAQKKVLLEAVHPYSMVFKFGTGVSYQTDPNGKTLDGSWDVVEEWKNPTPETKPTCDFKIGGTYLTRGGGIVKILRIHPHYDKPMEVLSIHGTCLGVQRLYAASGKWWTRDEPHPLDILNEPVMWLEVGKYYKTRSGRKVKVLAVTHNTHTPATVEFADNLDKRVYPLDGCWRLSKEPHKDDILEEWVEPSKPTLVLEVGKYYKTREGHKAKVERIGGPSVSHNVTVTTFDRPNPTTRTYTPQGQWAINLHESSLDLVAEWVEPEPVLEEGDIVIATTKGGREFVRIFAEYCDSEPKVYLDGSFYGSIAGNWASVKLLQKGKNAEA